MMITIIGVILAIGSPVSILDMILRILGIGA